LICDDDEPARTALIDILERNGCTAYAFASGHELVARAGALAPDAIVLDLFMPDLNGWETLAILKRQPSTAAIPVLVATALSRDADAPFNIAGWLRKPLDEASVLHAVEQAVAGAAARHVSQRSSSAEGT
jgi:CheY-like chemotaxis protein